MPASAAPTVFNDSMAAKEFLVSRIVEEARRRRTRLSDLERQMLYFSESYPTLPNMAEIAAAFDAQYIMEKYEARITRLAKRAFQRDRRESPELIPHWREAVAILDKEDHYILVMVDLPRTAQQWWTLVLRICAALLIGTFLIVGCMQLFGYDPMNLPKWLLAPVVAFGLWIEYIIHSDGPADRTERLLRRILGL